MNVFFDLDGTLAEWKKTSRVEDLKKPGYFYDLTADKKLCEFAKEISNDAYILSAYMLDCNALIDKKRWCMKHLPEINTKHLLFIPYGMNKGKFIRDVLGRQLKDDDVLIDDHSPNLIDWENEGGTGIKWINYVNNSKKSRFKGYRAKSIEEIKNIISIYN